MGWNETPKNIIKRSKRRRNGRQFLLNYFPFHMLRPCNGAVFKHMNIPLYFAYGSNMSQERLEDRVGKVIKIGTYVLKGYNLVFNVNECYANIEPGTEDVEGILYKLSEWDIKQLDLYEGHPQIYQKRHFVTDKGEICYLYLAEHPRGYTSKPKWDYLRHLIQGCVENNLSKTLEKLLRLKKDLKIKKPRGSIGFDSRANVKTHGVFRGRT